MYSGFITRKRVIGKFGIHQRFDNLAYKLILPMLKTQTFPTKKQILHFEGMNGPDGLKVKSPNYNEPSHLYNPKDNQGEVPTHIKNHYALLTEALKQADLIRASFEAAWLAHFITDGLTPAHHAMGDEIVGLDQKSSKIIAVLLENPKKLEQNPRFKKLKKQWGMWGGKGVMTRHFYFELGAATAMMLARIKVKFDWDKYELAQTKGPLALFRREAKDIAKLNLYDRFQTEGWNNKIAKIIKNQIAPQTIETIAVIWLLAYVEAGLLKIVKPARTSKKD